MPLISALSLGILALLLGIGIGAAAKKFGVDSDEREEKTLGLLPGVNCGGCGYPGCRAFACALVRGQGDPSLCAAAGGKAQREIAGILGIELKENEPQKAVVRCAGSKEAAKTKFTYDGVESCLAAGLILGGPKACVYGCLGFGDCVKACPFLAISMGDQGLPEIDFKKCTGCGACLRACPRNIIELAPEKRKFYAACVSRDRAKDVKTVCSAGCIGCGLCAKFASGGAVIMEDNLPVIKKDNDQDIEPGAQKCPVEGLWKKRP